MSGFEHAFALFGLLLGLSLAEVLGGFGRALEAHRTLRIGWLTPLLGILVILDIVSFWASAWNLRDHIVFSPAILLAGTAFAGGYYFAAYLIFPHRTTDATDLNAHYFDVRRPVLAIMAIASLIQYVHFVSRVGWHLVSDAWLLASFGILEMLLIANMFTRRATTASYVLATTVAFWLYMLLY